MSQRQGLLALKVTAESTVFVCSVIMFLRPGWRTNNLVRPLEATFTACLPASHLSQCLVIGLVGAHCFAKQDFHEEPQHDKFGVSSHG